MIRLFKHYIPHAVMLLGLCDLALLIVAGETAWQVRASQIGTDPGRLSERIDTLVGFAGVVWLAMIAVGTYGADALRSMRYAGARLLVAVSLGIIALSVLDFFLPGSTFWRSTLIYAMFLSIALLITNRVLVGSVIGTAAFRRRVLVLGDGQRARRIRELADRQESGFAVVSFIGMNEGSPVIDEAIPRAAIHDLGRFVENIGASEVVLALEERRNALPLKDLLRIKTMGVHVNDFSSFLERETGRVDLDTLNPSWLIFSDGFSSGRVLSSAAKRVFDVLASGLLLALTLPLIALFAVLVKLDSRGPAFFRQTRVGLYGQSFELLKLRSMRSDAEKDGAQWAAQNDPRVTRLGKFIRKVRIDELPQVWTVLTGKMSFVGPRPEVPLFVDDLEDKLPYYAERHMVKPGITGWAQINYPYGASVEDARAKLEYDLYYAKNYTPFLDLLILLQTLRVVLWPEGRADVALAQFWSVLGFFLYLGGAIACTLGAGFLWRRDGAPRRERSAAIAALAITAAWCVTNAAWGPGTASANVIESVRNLAWIAVLYRLFGADGRDQMLAPIRPLVFALAFVECLQPAVVVLSLRFGAAPAVQDTAFTVAALLRALVAVGALMLLHNLYAGASAVSRLVLRWPAVGLAAMWAFQLNLYTIAWIADAMPAELVALRGLVAGVVALLFAIGANARAADLKIVPSRAVAFQTLSLLVIGGYLAAMLLLGQSLSLLAGDAGRLTQVGFVFAAALMALLWLPSPRLRGWIRVKAAKHLFQHRYDYRAEWLRFTGTIGRAGASAPALPDRAAQALADITDSPGAVLLLPAEGGALDLAGRWQWREIAVPPAACAPEFAAMLERTGAVLELDEVRAGADRFDEQAVVPGWLRGDPRAWAVVPLIHFDRLVGVVVLARPALARRLDWEDFDLLKVVGRQLASYLAEQAGHEALIEASRFDEFNRRIAFVMHDIKNLASQLSLLARNAERHADKPEFRKDMLVTLTKSAEKLNALLARLGRYGAGGSAQRRPVDLAELARGVARRYDGIHPVELTRSDPCCALADADGLEQALVHLVQNAVDASAPGSPVFLDVSSTGLQGRVEVADSGPGMSPQFVRDSLFRPFVSSKEGGFGIGAFEARELVRAMGGRLDVESREGLGTRFAVVLPLSASAGFISGHYLESEVA